MKLDYCKNFWGWQNDLLTSGPKDQIYELILNWALSIPKYLKLVNILMLINLHLFPVYLDQFQFPKQEF